MRNRYFTIVASLALLAGLGVTLVGFKTIKSSNKNGIINFASKNVVILELFTSQGCNSCPPADAVLGMYANNRNSNIIPISFHIDYWNYLGWKDPYSQPGFSDRQRDYANSFNIASIYTPQLIINGKHQLIGSKKSEISDLIEAESELNNDHKIEIDSIRILPNHVKIKIRSDLTKKGIFLNVALIKKEVITNINKGENSGLKLTNYNTVFDFKSIPIEDISANEVLLRFDKNWIPSDYIIVAYAQNNVAGHIIAGTKIEFPLLN